MRRTADSVVEAQSMPIQLQLFGEHFVLVQDALCQQYWRRMAKELESEGELALLAKVTSIYSAVGIEHIPKRWLLEKEENERKKKEERKRECGRSVTVFHHSSYHLLSRRAA